MLKGDAASHYAARRLQLAAAGSSPKALLAAVVTTAHLRFCERCFIGRLEGRDRGVTGMLIWKGSDYSGE